MSLVIEMFMFLKQRKKLWLLPMLLLTALIGGLLMLAQGSVMAPFIYTIF